MMPDGGFAFIPSWATTRTEPARTTPPSMRTEATRYCERSCCSTPWLGAWPRRSGFTMKNRLPMRVTDSKVLLILRISSEMRSTHGCVRARLVGDSALSHLDFKLGGVVFLRHQLRCCIRDGICGSRRYRAGTGGRRGRQSWGLALGQHLQPRVQMLPELVMHLL